MFVDSHCHLAHRAFDEDRAEVLQRALDGGMPFLVDVGCTPEGSRAAVQLAEAHPEIWATCGIHPHDAATYGVEGARALLDELGDHPRVVAFGEMGLDFYYDRSPREVQIEVFRAQLEVARERDRPVVLHVRDSEDLALEMLADGGFPRGIWHCFSGNRAQAEAAVAGGLFVSFSGILTFPRSDELREAARAVPEERLLVETDCPYLAPVPKRGKRNEPSFVNHTGRFLAELRGREPEAMAALLTANTRRAFGLEEEA